MVPWSPKVRSTCSDTVLQNGRRVHWFVCVSEPWHVSLAVTCTSMQLTTRIVSWEEVYVPELPVRLQLVSTSCRKNFTLHCALARRMRNSVVRRPILNVTQSYCCCCGVLYSSTGASDWGWLFLRDPTEHVSPSLHLRTQTYPVLEMLFSRFLIPSHGQSPEPQWFWVLHTLVRIL
jgi:hypothetical protein